MDDPLNFAGRSNGRPLNGIPLASMPNALGRIVGSVTALRYSVRLDDGTNVEAILPKSVLHKIGCMLGPLQDGWGVTVSLHDPPKQHRIIAVTNAR